MVAQLYRTSYLGFGITGVYFYYLKIGFLKLSSYVNLRIKKTLMHI